MEEIILERVDSTNTYCREHLAELQAPMMVRAVAQDAGRGQRGNSWESEPGKNLTFSILWHPEGVGAAEQFSISEAVSLGILDFLTELGLEGKVKWPNDIYVGDKKICGILIEHFLFGSEIEHSILGVGINVNQRDFVSDAPNPVSVFQLTGRELELDEKARRVGELIESRLLRIGQSEGKIAMHLEYLENLWRKDGRAYPFRDMVHDELYEGVIEDVEPAGVLVIRPVNEPDDGLVREGFLRRYAFKEVVFIV